MTGKYSVSVGVWPSVFEADSIGGLSHDHETLAERLKRLGYRTGHAGKWHLGVGVDREHLPTRRGFDSYLGIPYSHDMCPCRVCFPDQGPCEEQCRPQDISCPLFKDEKVIEQPADLTRITDKYTEWAIDFIQEDDEKPFFLYMAYSHVHNPQFAGSA